LLLVGFSSFAVLLVVAGSALEGFEGGFLVAFGVRDFEPGLSFTSWRLVGLLRVEVVALGSLPCPGSFRFWEKPANGRTSITIKMNQPAFITQCFFIKKSDLVRSKKKVNKTNNGERRC
jgi:hypothetical protein